jgi:lipopolysaccharide export system protein LptC
MNAVVPPTPIAPPRADPPAATPPARPPARPRRTGRDWYSFFVGRMKYLLPAVALALIGVALLWPNLSTGGRSILSGMPKIKPEAVAHSTMEAPRFVGTDDKNRPFRVEAKTARQVPGDSDSVLLEEPKARLTLDGGNLIVVTARRGRFNNKTRQLTLEGDVYVWHDANYTFRTEIAHVDLPNNSAHGDRPVTASGPKGAIEAAGFRILEKGQRVVFTGKSRVVLRIDEQDAREATGDSRRGRAPAERAPAERAPTGDRKP